MKFFSTTLFLLFFCGYTVIAQDCNYPQRFYGSFLRGGGSTTYDVVLLKPQSTSECGNFYYSPKLPDMDNMQAPISELYDTCDPNDVDTWNSPSTWDAEFLTNFESSSLMSDLTSAISVMNPNQHISSAPTILAPIIDDDDGIMLFEPAATPSESVALAVDIANDVNRGILNSPGGDGVNEVKFRTFYFQSASLNDRLVVTSTGGSTFAIDQNEEPNASHNNFDITFNTSHPLHNSFDFYDLSTTPGEWKAFFALKHEIGHAIGFGHVVGGDSPNFPDPNANNNSIPIMFSLFNGVTHTCDGISNNDLCLQSSPIDNCIIEGIRCIYSTSSDPCEYSGDTEVLLNSQVDIDIPKKLLSWTLGITDQDIMGFNIYCENEDGSLSSINQKIIKYNQLESKYFYTVSSKIQNNFFLEIVTNSTNILKPF